MDKDTLFSALEELYPKYITVWEDVCLLESPTSNKAAVDTVGKYFSDMADKRGWKIEVCKQAKAGDAMCITMNADVNAPAVTMSGHIDTVHPLGLFPTPAVRRDDKNIYGPGVTDCKGGVVASFMAMDALAACCFKGRPVKLVIQTDEEVGSAYSNKETIRFMCECAKGSAAFLNTEGMIGGRAVLQRKGILRYKFTVRGVAAHSSICNKASNAITEAAHKIIELEKMKDENGLTCNCGVISGGTVANTVAEECAFTADIRFLNNDQQAEAERIVEEIAKSTFVLGCSCDTELLSSRPAMEYSKKNYELFDKINEINKDLGISALERVFEVSGSDAAYVSAYGIPTIDNLGVDGDFIHSTREYARLDSLLASARQLAVVAAYL